MRDSGIKEDLTQNKGSNTYTFIRTDAAQQVLQSFEYDVHNTNIKKEEIIESLLELLQLVTLNAPKISPDKKNSGP